MVLGPGLGHYLIASLEAEVDQVLQWDTGADGIVRSVPDMMVGERVMVPGVELSGRVDG